MNIVTITEARARLFHFVDQTNESHEPIHIKGKRGNAVMISEEDYDALMETLYINSIKGLSQSILKASKESLDECSDTLDW